VHSLCACLSEALHGANEVMEEGSVPVIGAEAWSTARIPSLEVQDSSQYIGSQELSRDALPRDSRV
jgi:hypothetical protein